MKNNLKFVTDKVVLNYPNLINPKKNNKTNEYDKPKFGSAILISKSCEKSSKMYNFSPENVQAILRHKVYKSMGDGFPM